MIPARDPHACFRPFTRRFRSARPAPHADVFSRVGRGGRLVLAVGGTNCNDAILIAGFTAHDGDATLVALMEEWARADRTYEPRVEALQAGVGPGAACRFGAATVGHDDEEDVLTGGSGLDWFLFGAARDHATDLSDEAFANDLDFIVDE